MFSSPRRKPPITPTKPLATQNDLALAYSPGVAAACNAIVDDATTAALYTARSNLVGVVTNGTAVLGLGNIGPLASKPVMEGKAVLFKKFSGIDVFDIEINQPDVDKFIDTVAALEPTFGGINLEDIKAPECFEVERRLRERMNIPVFHDDQHGTAIIVTAAVISALKVVNKIITEVRLVASGAGAAALACLNQLVSAGLCKENIIVTDRSGVIHTGRAELDQWKAAYAVETDLRTLDEVIASADIFLGLSGPGILKAEMVVKMADQPIIMALANPTPEILPEEVKAVRDDAIICTGRSDYPNQVNNVLCFPYIFRGALDVGATTCADFDIPNNIGPTVTPPPSIFNKFTEILAASTFGITSKLALPFNFESGNKRCRMDSFNAASACISPSTISSGWFSCNIFTALRAISAE